MKMFYDRIRQRSVIEFISHLSERVRFRIISSCMGAAFVVISQIGCVQNQPHLHQTPAFTVRQYRISPNDSLEVTFSDEPQLTQQARVSWDGKINLPYLNSNGKAEIVAAGKTPVELVAVINQVAKASGMLVSPLANVRILDYADQAFVVYGQVNNPGRFLFPKGYPPRMSILEAVGISGGFTRLARPNHVLLKRGEEVIRLDLRDMMSQSGAEQFEIQPGDVITVPERIL
jgi:protein involved in polysaccharide export with SLBB domain